MSDTQFTVRDMVQAAGEQSPSAFQSAFASIMLDKIAASVEAKKVEMAKNYFNYDDAEDTSVEQEEEPNEDTEAAA